MITISNYNPSDKYKGFAHLELGAANYGPEVFAETKKEPTPWFYFPSKEQDFLLKEVADHIISNNAGEKQFVFYLNDIDEVGLHRAADSLKMHLTMRKSRNELPDVDIKIVKIVADMTTFKQWPKVDNAHLLNPHRTINCRTLFQCYQNAPMPLSWYERFWLSFKNPMLSVLRNVSQVSKNGIYVSDINLPESFVDFMKGIMKNDPTSFKKCLSSYGIQCIPEENGHFSHYIFPNGFHWEGGALTFRAVQQ